MLRLRTVVALLTLIASALSAQPSPDEAFAAGLADRTSFEQWFSGLATDTRSGAEFWAGQRSLRQPRPCDDPARSPQWQAGCDAAKGRLAPSDLRRRAEPRYREGWNSYSASSGTSSVNTITPTPQINIRHPLLPNNPQWRILYRHPRNGLTDYSFISNTQNQSSNFQEIWILQNFESFIDRTHVRGENNQIIEVPAGLVGPLSIVQRSHIDCTSLNLRILSVTNLTLHMGRGDIISQDVTPTPWRPIPVNWRELGTLACGIEARPQSSETTSIILRRPFPLHSFSGFNVDDFAAQNYAECRLGLPQQIECTNRKNWLRTIVYGVCQNYRNESYTINNMLQSSMRPEIIFSALSNSPRIPANDLNLLIRDAEQYRKNTGRNDYSEIAFSVCLQLFARR